MPPRTRDRSRWTEEERLAYIAGVTLAMRVLKGRLIRLRMRIRQNPNAAAEYFWERLMARGHVLRHRLITVFTDEELRAQAGRDLWLDIWFETTGRPGDGYWKTHIWNGVPDGVRADDDELWKWKGQRR